MFYFDDEKEEISTDKEIIDQAIKEGIVPADQASLIQHPMDAKFIKEILDNPKVKLLIQEKQLTLQLVYYLRGVLFPEERDFDKYIFPIVKKFIQLKKDGLLKHTPMTDEDFISRLLSKYRELPFLSMGLYFINTEKFFKLNHFNSDIINEVVVEHEYAIKRFESLKSLFDLSIYLRKEKNDSDFLDCYLQAVGFLSPSYMKEFLNYVRNMVQEDKNNFKKRLPLEWALIKNGDYGITADEIWLNEKGQIAFYNLDDENFNKFLSFPDACYNLKNCFLDFFKNKMDTKIFGLGEFQINPFLKENFYYSLKYKHHSNSEVIKKYQALSSILNKLNKYKNKLKDDKEKYRSMYTDKKVKAISNAMGEIIRKSGKPDILENLHVYLKDEFVKMQEHRGKIGKFFSGIAKTHGHEVMDEIMKIVKEHEDAHHKVEVMKQYSK